MTELADIEKRMDAEKAAYEQEKAKTPKERLGESMLKAGLSVMSSKTEGKKTGGAIKAKGWGKARGARAAKVY